jgi:hypothetical protein
MGQNLLALSSPRMGGSCLIQSCRIGIRFLRRKFYPWIALVIALLGIATASGVHRTYAKIRYRSAMSKINFVAVYELLNELLW